MRHLVQTMQRADGHNFERLRQAFPQVAAALEVGSWYEAPPGFEPRYDAPAITVLPDKDLGAMVEAILADSAPTELAEQWPSTRVAAIHNTAQRLKVALAQREAVMGEMARVVEGLQSIVAESEGVVGWHLNGAVAPWDEFEFIAGVDEAFKKYEARHV